MSNEKKIGEASVTNIVIAPVHASTSFLFPIGIGVGYGISDVNTVYEIDGEFEYDNEIFKISPYPVRFNSYLEAVKFFTKMETSKHSVFRCEKMNNSDTYILIGTPVFNSINIWYILIGSMLILYAI